MRARDVKIGMLVTLPLTSGRRIYGVVRDKCGGGSFEIDAGPEFVYLVVRHASELTAAEAAKEKP